MKEFIYYQNLLNQFSKIFKEYEKMQQIWHERNQLGLEDDALAWHLDFLLNEAGGLCCNNALDDFGDICTAYDYNKQINFYNSNNELISYECKNIIELFDICYATYLKNNLLHTIKTYLSFCSETYDSTLFLCWDNEFIDQMYSDMQLAEIAKEITNELDNNNLTCWYDGEKFELTDKRYTSIENAEHMENCIKAFCKDLNINYEEFDY